MWSRQNKVWMHYLNNIIAADVASAVMLSSFMRRTVLSRSQAGYLEVIDLQRYKIITKPMKVRAAISDAGDTPFIFVVGKN